MSKIRRVDFSPDEFLVGVTGMSVEEIGLYWIACTLIYSRGEPIDNDAHWIGRIAGVYRAADGRRLLDRLIARGKLTINADGKLVNGRAMAELGRARRRVDQARDNGGQGGRPPRSSRADLAPKSHRKRADIEPNSGNINDLEKPDGFENQKLTINSSNSSNSSKESKKESDGHPSGVRRARARKTKPKTSSSNGASHGQRIPDDFRLTPDLVRYAEERSFNAQAQADAFVDHWRASNSQSAIKRDWSAAYRTWIRRADEYRRREAPRNVPGNRPARSGNLVSAALRIRARDQDH